MDTGDPKLIALQFNECINRRDVDGLTRFMSDDHAFIDREGSVHQPRDVVVEAWKKFFASFPDYRNTFTRVESTDNLVVILGFAYWSEKQPHDPAIWTATIVDDRVREWRIYPDTRENRKRFNVF